MPRLLLLPLMLFMTASAASEIVDNPEQVRPLLPGQSVPAFELKSVAGEAIHIDPAAAEAYRDESHERLRRKRAED